jgi:hypothetical protein
MEYFLESIAQSLYKEFGNSLNRHCLVFPNRRAGLYFLKYLATKIQKPVWTPAIFTVNELFRSYTSLQTAGNEILLFELYKVYRRIKKSPESFDDFYFWGDMLLNDFDDIDKYIVNASLLFHNVVDLKNIDQQFGGLTDTQIEIIKRFWINFDHGKPTNEKSGFTSIWSLLNDLYSEFRNSLKKQNLAYEGMIFRELAEDSEKAFTSATHWEMLHFIGFNALNNCEKAIMTSLKKAGKARFYWDYDNSYIKDGNVNSAGHFLRENLKLFGNDMPSGWSYDTMLSASPPDVRRRVIETSSDVAQVKLISQLIDDIPGLTSGNAHHTAVILADENLLMPVLTSLPEEVGDINITMGYPLKLTLVYTLLKHLMELQRTAVKTENGTLFSFRSVLGILKHSLMSGLITGSDIEISDEIVKTNQVWVPSDRFAHSENLLRVFYKPLTPALLSVYFKDILSLIASNDSNGNDDQANGQIQRNIRNEFIYRIVLSINRLEVIVNSPDIVFTTETYIKILDRMLRSQSVPFSGEPLSGIQIMGILETRALDFKNLIILSVNDGILPAVSSGSSFIPFNLREAFGLPSVNHQESIYAYHFYRLLQRAEDVTFIYNSNSEGLRSGEMSRFLIQMKFDKSLRPDFLDLSFEIKSHNIIGAIIERRDNHIQQLNSQFLDNTNKRILSPSAINTWLNCRMKFFYRYVNGLKEPEIVSADIDPAMLGNILHEVMKNLYSDFLGKVLTGEMVDYIVRNTEALQRVIKAAVREEFKEGGKGLVSGNELIVSDVLMAFVKRILNTDKTIAPITILNLEDPFSFNITANPDGNQIELCTGGVVDRIDVVSGVTRIVDYKTGAVIETIGSIGDLFTEDRKKDADGWLQTLLYCEAYLSANKSVTVRPSIYKIKKLSGGLLSDALRLKSDSKTELVIDEYKIVREEFINGLKEITGKIFGSNEPFIMTRDLRGKCGYCPYKALCNR